MTVKLLTEHHLEFLSLKGGCIGSSKSTLVKMSNCWKSHAAAHMVLIYIRDAFQTSPSSAEDNIESSHSDLVSWCRYRKSPVTTFFYFFLCHYVSVTARALHAEMCFPSDFSLHKRLCLIGRLFDGKPDKLLRMCLNYAKKR